MRDLTPSACRSAFAAALSLAAVAGFTAPVLAAPEELSVGITADSTLLTTGFKLALGIWAAILLLRGFRMGRGVAGSFFLVVGLAFGAMVSGFSIALALLIVFAIFAVGMAIYAWVPRLAMAIAMLWPFVMLYLARLYFAGSFDRSGTVMIGLAVLGAIIGALFPKLSRIFVSTSMGALLLIAVLPFSSSLPLLLGLIGAGLGWQLFMMRRHRRRRADGLAPPVYPLPTRAERWKGALTGGAATLIVAMCWVVIAIPRYDAAKVPDPGRLQALDEQGSLGRPGILFGPNNNYYLSGRPLPVSLVSGQGQWWSRWIFPITGRSLVGPVHRLRAVKNEAELEAMRRAAVITSQAFADLEPLIRPGVNESEIAQSILRTFRENGATGVAFNSIVGSGPNAVLPHYEANDDEMTEGLVVIDIGCEIDHYASDMTRTFPVSGEPNEAEAHLLNVVIAAADAAREALQPGVSFRDVHEASADVIDEAGFGEYYTHRVGHHVGLSVHDPGDDPLAAGMVITIEPGIYVPEGADSDPAYWNLGVRIEDTYVLTEDGWEEITSFPWYPGGGDKPAEVEPTVEVDQPVEVEPASAVEPSAEPEPVAEDR